MYVRTIDVLDGQCTALLAPAEEARDLYRERVMEPLRPLWEHIVRFMPAGESRGPGEEDPALSAARLIGLYSPDSGAEEGSEHFRRWRKRGP